MDRYEVSKFLKEQRKKTDEDYYRDSEKRKISSARTRDEPYEEPSNTIMIRGLPSDITEDEIKLGLDDMRANYIAVRLIKDKRTGANKGIAFVEFIAVNDAKDLMYDTRGELYISGYYGKLTYGYNVKEEVDRYDAEKTNSWKHEKPTNTVMLRGVSSMLSDNEVRSYVSDVSKHVVDVRLIRDKKTGMSRGFGFVEFDSVAEAQRWMEYQQGYFLIDDVEMKLSFTSTRQGNTQVAEYFTTDSGDWSCARCGGHNFKRREFCYKCHLSKTQSKSVMETIDGKDQIGSSPCNTLILRDLDALSLEDDIVKALQAQFNSKVRQCEIMRDDVTKVSRCFAFVEFASLSESRKIVEYYEDYPDRVFELSGKAITIDFAKNNFNTLMTSYKEALAKRFEETYEPPVHETSNYDANAAAAVAQAALNNKKNQKKNCSGSSNVLPSNVTVDVRNGESSAMSFELIVNGQRCTSVPTNPFNMANIAGSTFVTPDTTKFLYDQSTQYYFDPTTGLYYDANSQYFFDRMSQKYLYWDQTKSTYVAVDIQAATATDNSGQAKSATGSATVATRDGSDKKNKANEAKKIAKEMERWERMVNSKKDHGGSSSAMAAKAQEALQVTDSNFCMFSDNMTTTRPEYCSMTADDLVAEVYNSDSDQDNHSGSGSGDCKIVIPPPQTSSSSPGQVQSPGSRDQSNMTTAHSVLMEEEAKLLNYDKMTCLLCNRGFKDRATLDKHRAVSDLHKKNMEALKDRLGLADCAAQSSVTTTSTASVSGAGSSANKMKYRDRAKERRDKFGIPSPPASVSKRKYEAEIAEQQQYQMQQQSATVSAAAVDVSADGENIGSKLMAKMGWQHGQGLGKMNQGRTDIIQAEFVARGAGIGAAPRMPTAPTDNYRENLKRAMYAKYHDL